MNSATASDGLPRYFPFKGKQDMLIFLVQHLMKLFGTMQDPGIQNTRENFFAETLHRRDGGGGDGVVWGAESASILYRNSIL